MELQDTQPLPESRFIRENPTHLVPEEFCVSRGGVSACFCSACKFIFNSRHTAHSGRDLREKEAGVSNLTKVSRVT